MNIGRTLSHIVLGAGVTVALAVAVGTSDAQIKAGAKVTTDAVKVKVNKGGLGAAFDKYVGAIAIKCPAAQAAQTALTTCKETCTTAAANAGITPAELAKCGDMPADDCANSIMQARAAACMSTAGAAGCLDQAKALDQANQACANCAESRANVIAAHKAAIQAEADLAAAQAAASRAANVLASAKAHQKDACQAAK